MKQADTGDTAALTEAIALLRAWQSWMGSERSRIDVGNRAAWDAIERLVPTLTSMRDRDSGAALQPRVAAWMAECFIPTLYANMTERGDRLVEEVFELLQSKGYDRSRIPTLVDYVWNRPVGEPAQEVGGVMVTLAAYCAVAGLDMQRDGAAELARITRPEVMAKIRAKQEAKNALQFDTPLPGDAGRAARSDDRILWGVVANAGRLSGRRKRRWSHVSDATGEGSTRSAELCRRFGFDPHEECGGSSSDEAVAESA